MGGVRQRCIDQGPSSNAWQGWMHGEGALDPKDLAGCMGIGWSDPACAGGSGADSTTHLSLHCWHACAVLLIPLCSVMASLPHCYATAGTWHLAPGCWLLARAVTRWPIRVPLHTPNPPGLSVSTFGRVDASDAWRIVLWTGTSVVDALSKSGVWMLSADRNDPSN